MRRLRLAPAARFARFGVVSELGTSFVQKTRPPVDPDGPKTKTSLAGPKMRFRPRRRPFPPGNGSSIPGSESSIPGNDSVTPWSRWPPPRNRWLPPRSRRLPPWSRAVIPGNHSSTPGNDSEAPNVPLPAHGRAGLVVRHISGSVSVWISAPWRQSEPLAQACGPLRRINRNANRCNQRSPGLRQVL